MKKGLRHRTVRALFREGGKRPVDENGMSITVLGTRGSVTTGGRDREIFGGDTSCYMVRAGGETVFLDAGSGLISAPAELPRPPHILLSHLHIDHVLGLGMYPRLSQKGQETTIHVPVGPGEDPKELLDRLYSPPLWPLSLSDYAGTVRILPLTFPLRIGELTVEGLPGCHPGGSVIMKLTYAGRSIVYATDYEYEERSADHLEAFARGTDLLLFDGQYTEPELPARRGFGHSTAEKGLALMERSGARRLLLIHHDPRSTDDMLLAREAQLPGRARYARKGERIVL